MINHAAMQLGRHAPSMRQRAMATPLGRYLTAPLPTAPDEIHQATGAAIALLGNDRVGNCTVVGLTNNIAIRRKLEGQLFVPDEAAVMASYYRLSGGVDSGLIEIDVLNAAASEGIDIGEGAPTQIAAWVTVPVANRDARRSLIALFGSLYLGVRLPLSCQGQEIWQATGWKGRDAPGSWGGHCLLESGYAGDDSDLVTWGEVQLANEDFIQEYVDEAYVLLDAKGAELANVDWAGLLSDLQAAQALGG